MSHSSYSDLGSKAQLCRRTGSGNCVRGTRVRVGVLRGVGVRISYPGSLRTKRPALWPSLDLISSASAQSSLHFLCATGPRRAIPLLQLLNLRAMHSSPPLCSSPCSRSFLLHFGLDTIFDSARGGDVMRSAAVRNDDACYACSGGTCECDGRARTGWLGKRRRSAKWPPALVFLLMTSWSTRIRVRPQRPVCLHSPCARSVRFWSPRCSSLRASSGAQRVRITDLELSHPSRPLLRSSFHSSPSRRFAYAGICSSPPTGVPRPAAHVLRIGFGGAGNRRRLRLARCAVLVFARASGSLFL
jgi:hypothetical protein